MRYENEEMIDDGTLPVPYVQGTPPTPPKSLATKDFYTKFSWLKTTLGAQAVEAAAKITDELINAYPEDYLYEIINALYDLSNAVTAHPYEVAEHLRAAMLCARQKAINADRCPDCGEKLCYRYITNKISAKHCDTCGWDEEDD